MIKLQIIPKRGYFSNHQRHSCFFRPPFIFFLARTISRTKPESPSGWVRRHSSSELSFSNFPSINSQRFLGDVSCNSFLSFNISVNSFEICHMNKKKITFKLNGKKKTQYIIEEWFKVNLFGFKWLSEHAHLLGPENISLTKILLVVIWPQELFSKSNYTGVLG